MDGTKRDETEETKPNESEEQQKFGEDMPPKGDEQMVVSENNSSERELDELDRLMGTKDIGVDGGGSDADANKDQVSYTFEICDILLNIGPCGNSLVAESSADMSEFASGGVGDETSKHHLMPHSIDLVTSSGYAKNGAISLLQRSLRPDLIATFQIPDVIDMWSLVNDSEHSPYSPTYLFLSKGNSTVVLQIANEITELDKDTTAFCTKSATIYCANILNNKYLMQVSNATVLHK